MIEDSFPVAHMQFRGKRWIYDPHRFNIQCAYCVNLQQTRIIREVPDDRLSLVIGLQLENESHKEDCPQEVKE